MKDIKKLVLRYRSNTKKFVFKKEILKHVLLTLGISASVFLYVAAKPWDKSDCRRNMRLYGYKFYLSFNEAKKPIFQVQNNNDKCYYEFFEGIHKASTVFSPNYSKLEKVCSYINKSYPVKSWDQCYFKIGIASTYTKRDTVYDLLDLEKFIDKQIKFCEKSGKHAGDCIVGVYTGVNLAFQNNDKDSGFGLMNDLFWPCKTGMGKAYKLQCFRGMVSLLYGYTKGDSAKAKELIFDNLTDKFERFEVTLTYFSSLAYIDEYDPYKVARLCTSIDEGFVRYACILGYATGIDEVAGNGNEGKAVVDFCVNELFSFNETGECIRRGFFELPTTWNIDSKKKICLQLSPIKYKNYCELNMEMPKAAKL